MSGDDIDNPLALDRPEYVEARRRGAVGILRFSSSADSRGNVVSRSFELPLSDSAPVDERRALDRQMVQMARMYRDFLDDRRAEDSARVDTAPPRSKWGAWQRKQQQAMLPRMAQAADMMKQVFQGRPVPPDVAAFVAECAKRCGPPPQR